MMKVENTSKQEIKTIVEAQSKSSVTERTLHHLRNTVELYLAAATRTLVLK